MRWEWLFIFWWVWCGYFLFFIRICLENCGVINEYILRLSFIRSRVKRSILLVLMIFFFFFLVMCFVDWLIGFIYLKVKYIWIRLDLGLIRLRKVGFCGVVVWFFLKFIFYWRVVEFLELGFKVCKFLYFLYYLGWCEIWIVGVIECCLGILFCDLLIMYIWFMRVCFVFCFKIRC